MSQNHMEFAMALGEYLIQLATISGTDRFHCSQVMPSNPYYKPEHGRQTQMAWSPFDFGGTVAYYFPENIEYDGPSGWFTVKAMEARPVQVPEQCAYCKEPTEQVPTPACGYCGKA